MAVAPPAEPTARRAAFNAVLDANVTSVAAVTHAFMPLLSGSSSSSTAAGAQGQKPLVVNVSSARGSLTRATSGALPPTANVAYSVSKVALNGLTVELAALYAGVAFHCVNPGHCKTGLNGFRGARDPAEGVEVVVQLVRRHAAGSLSVKDGQVGGFWETVGSDTELLRVPW